MIINYLQSNNKYEEAIIEDVSGIEANCDIKFVWQNIKCLIEIKNKQYITIEDVEKFNRDIVFNSDNINAGIFISLRTNVIPKMPRENMQVVYIRGHPCLFLYVDNLIMIDYAICLIKRILSIKNDDKKTLVLSHHCITFYNILINLQKESDTKIKKLQKELKDEQKRLHIYGINLELLESDKHIFINNENVND
jgi:hypothetical protein